MNQRLILLEYLRRNGWTSCADLERLCDVRSVTSRIAELKRQGYPILKRTAYRINPKGAPRAVTHYALAASPGQLDLFTDTT